MPPLPRPTASPDPRLPLRAQLLRHLRRPLARRRGRVPSVPPARRRAREHPATGPTSSSGRHRPPAAEKAPEEPTAAGKIPAGKIPAPLPQRLAPPRAAQPLQTPLVARPRPLLAPTGCRRRRGLAEVGPRAAVGLRGPRSPRGCRGRRGLAEAGPRAGVGLRGPRAGPRRAPRPRRALRLSERPELTWGQRGDGEALAGEKAEAPPRLFCLSSTDITSLHRVRRSARSSSRSSLRSPPLSPGETFTQVWAPQYSRDLGTLSRAQ